MEQCKLPKAVLDKVPAIESHWHDPLEAAEQIIDGMPNPPGVRRAGSKAFYNSVSDRITLPSRKLFVSAEEEAATRFHEYAHYADFRIMPRFLYGPVWLMGRGREHAGIIRALPGRRATYRLVDSDRVMTPRVASSPLLFL